jgi:choline dehydrogenase-like flavoprotein
MPLEKEAMMSASIDTSFDAIVVGTGPGGATVARELSRDGQHVLMLERGPNEPVRGTASQTMREFMWPGRGLKFTPDLASVGRGITTGGSSVFFCATAFDPPYEMFRRHGIDLAGDVAELKAELPYGPLDEGLIGPFANAIMTAARDLGFDWRPLQKLVFQESCRADCDSCFMGCPHGAKWTSRVFVDEAVEAGAVLSAGKRVRRVLTDGGCAVGVEASAGGERMLIHAPRVVLSAGGIGTAEILHSSGLDGAGREFFFDPLVAVIGILPEMEGGREFPMAAGIHLKEDECVLTDLTWPRWMYRIFASAALRFGRIGSHEHAAVIMVKIRDELDGRITRRGGVRKRLTAADRFKLRRGADHARRILRHAGATHIFTSRVFATHPGGTAKVGEVVDSNLQAETDGLFVCDCSVIPEPWGLPPTLTILALGKRLGRHLAA